MFDITGRPHETCQPNSQNFLTHYLLGTVTCKQRGGDYFIRNASSLAGGYEFISVLVVSFVVYERALQNNSAEKILQ